MDGAPIWIVTAVACADCNAVGVAVFDHVPSDEEMASVKAKIGDMRCIDVDVAESVIGAPVEMEQHP